MKVIRCRNVNWALPRGCALLQSAGIPRPSRVGDTLEHPEPVATVYKYPTERVLFSKERDAHPFFHLFEALWMLAGRNDIDFPARFAPRIRDYSDDGQVDHGAYGFRWREWFGFDQLETVVELLRRDPGTRRAVVQMWSPQGDLVTSEGAGGIHALDIPCNTSIYFKVRDGSLRMTVSNRSNDMLWGAYGANVVHMSILQEYIASKLGLPLGPYVQVSDSFHVYTSNRGGDIWARVKDLPVNDGADPYTLGEVSPYPLNAGEHGWDADLVEFFDRWDSNVSPVIERFRTNWFNNVVTPLWSGWRHKDRAAIEKCAASDWRRAGLEWMDRRGK